MNRRMSRVQMVAPSEEEDVPVAPKKKKTLEDWVEMLHKFTDEHKEKCRPNAVMLPPMTEQRTFRTGSQYIGPVDVLGLNGAGMYDFPNGSTYNGDFKDGLFHGEGQLRFSNGLTVSGRFDQGEMTERKLVFANGLEYSEKDWLYCKSHDRRYEIEYESELQPGTKTFLTAEQPTREVPEGMYDTGDGFYDPINTTIYDVDCFGNTTIVRRPGMDENKWIMENCRSGTDGSVGVGCQLYEEWQEPQLNPVPPPPPAAGTTALRYDFGSFDTLDDSDFYVVISKSKSACSFASQKSQSFMKHKAIKRCSRASRMSGVTHRRSSTGLGSLKITKTHRFRWQDCNG